MGLGDPRVSPSLPSPAPRKRAMIINNALAFLGGALMGLAKLGCSYEMMILGRFLIGAYSGNGQRPPANRRVGPLGGWAGGWMPGDVGWGGVSWDLGG